MREMPIFIIQVFRRFCIRFDFGLQTFEIKKKTFKKLKSSAVET